MSRIKTLVVVLIAFLLVGCQPEAPKGLIIGVIQFGDFASLNDTLEGLEKELNEDQDLNLIVKSAQGEAPNVINIAQQFVDDEVDLIVAITTQSAQAAIGARGDKEIPIVFAAVSDPVGAGVKGVHNVTGVSDAAPLDLQFDLIETLTPLVKKVGVLFKTGDPNGVYQTSLVTQEGAKRGIEVISKGAMEVTDLSIVAHNLAMQVDALYLITDGLIVGNSAIIVEEARRVGIFSYASEDGQFDTGILASNSISYLDIGQQVGVMVRKILKENINPNTIEIEVAKRSYPQISSIVADEFGIIIPDSLQEYVK